MDLNITGRHVEITPALRDFVAEKADRLARYFDRIGRLQVTLDVEGDRHRAEMIINGIKGVTIVGEETADDMYAAVDSAVDKLIRQLKKYQTRVRRGRGKEGLSEAAQTDDTVSDDDQLPSYQETVDDV